MLSKAVRMALLMEIARHGLGGGQSREEEAQKKRDRQGKGLLRRRNRPAFTEFALSLWLS